LEVQNTILSDCIITRNSADGQHGAWGPAGGGIWCRNTVIVNCLIAWNDCRNNSTGMGAGIYCSENVDIVNCTITGNSTVSSDGGIYCESSTPINITNCIVRGNQCAEIGAMAGTVVNVTNCDVQGGYAGMSNIDVNPLFVSAMQGWYLLSQTEAGQSGQSPCVDAGSDLAENIRFNTPMGEISLSNLTTRTDGVADTGTVDLGFHYNGTYLDPYPAPGIDLFLEDPVLTAGELFSLNYSLNNPSNIPMEADVFILLQIEDVFWSFPTWRPLDQGLDAEVGVHVDPYSGIEEVVLECTWPELSGTEGSFTFIGAACETGTYNFIGDIDYAEGMY